MNSQEFDFGDLENFELQVAVDNIVEQFGFDAVMHELEERAFAESAKFFEDIIVKSREREQNDK